MTIRSYFDILMPALYCSSSNSRQFCSRRSWHTHDLA